MTNENQTEKKNPTHTVYYLKYNDGVEKPEWQQIGVGWENKDGLGFNLSVTSASGDRVPMVVRKNKPKRSD